MRLTIRGEYARDWPDIADRAKAQAGHRCVRCGHPDGDRMFGGARVLKQCTVECTHLRDGKLRMLTVHHLDGDKGNNRWWNLLALCQACHLSVQARVNPEVGLLFDPRPWAMPYIAGFYEAGRGVLGVGYDLGRWIGLYNEAAFGALCSGERRTWPEWAPRVQRRLV